MTEALELEISVPEILAPLYEPRRYKVMHGGRGGGKSHTVAQVLLEMGTREQLRILCAREIQKSMRDSVHRLLKDYIVKLGLTAFYEVLDTEIRGVNGTLFLFAGLQSHTVDSIKSFEGVDRVWIEEAHAISKKSLDTLIPTIRKDGSEIWMTLNPDMETDEVYQRFIATPSPDTWVCQVNWRDNPWLPQVLEEERQKAKRSMLADDYAHIWEGKARRVAAGAIYRHEIEHLYADNRAGRVPYDPRIPVHTVWDLGWNDSMTIAMVQVGPQDVRVIDYIEDSHRTYDWYVTQLEKRPYRWGTDYLPHDGKTKNAQTGKNAEMVLKELGRSRVVCLSALDVEEGIKSARMMFPRCYFDSAKTARLLECLKRYQRAIHTSTGEAMGPLHDEFSHGADCFRYLSQAAEHMLRSQQQKPLAPVGGGWAPLDREIGY
ncbi:MAG: PBSX family phage terminase large subunit [Aquabacterium commune]|uniref:PBSX family phage terminase large subunit n=1 Tax=Aquabacterium commune TaxID=70586 RepID=UPI003BAE4009